MCARFGKCACLCTSRHDTAIRQLPANLTEQPRGTADDICRALEQSAAENALPVEFFARTSSELASASDPFDLCLHHPLNYAGQVFVQP